MEEQGIEHLKGLVHEMAAIAKAVATIKNNGSGIGNYAKDIEPVFEIVTDVPSLIGDVPFVAPEIEDLSADEAKELLTELLEEVQGVYDAWKIAE